MEWNVILVILVIIFCIAVRLAYYFLSKSKDESDRSDHHKSNKYKPSRWVYKDENKPILWNIEIKDQEIKSLKTELDRYITANHDLKMAIILSFFTKQHLLIESIPWLAKTTTVRLFSRLVDFEQKRVQWTPDLLPSDIVGNQIMVWEDIKYNKWPIFTNILLFDEINRTTPKTQSALIQAMEEKQVTLYGQDMDLPDPFVVFATLNPIEQRWTYALPEAQLDRFGMKVILDYPTKEEEKQIISISTIDPTNIKPVITQQQYYDIANSIDQVKCDDEILEYVADILEQSRIGDDIKIGWSPRSGKDMIKYGKCIAYIRWSDEISKNDIDMIKNHVLSHRIIKN